MKVIAKSRMILVLLLSAIMLFPTEAVVFAETTNAPARGAEKTTLGVNTSEAGREANADLGSGLKSGTNADKNGDIDAGDTANKEADTDTNAGTNTGADPNANADTGTNTNTDSNANADTNTDADSDADTDTNDEGLIPPRATPHSISGEVADLGIIDVAKGPMGNTAELMWGSYEGASYYKVYSPEYNSGAEQKVSAMEGIRPSVFIPNLNAGTEYNFKIEAYDETDLKIAEGAIAFKTYSIIFNESAFRVLTDRYASATKLRYNLRKKLKEDHDGYSVTQGACTDGTYAYYMMTSSTTQNGKIVKMRISDNKLIATSPKVLKTHHANGMTYDSKRDRLVAVGFKKWRHQLTFIDPVTLKQKGKGTLNYPYTDMEAVSNGYSQNGIAAIAYIEKYDIYLTRVRGDINNAALNDIMIFDADTLNMIGYVRTQITAAYPETYQSMDADEKYVYFLLSEGKGQPNNIILALDWNAENLLPVINGEKPYIQNIWSCGNDGSGRADAVIRIGTPHEAEGLYHTTDSAGNNHFYVSEYYGRWKYKKVTKKVKYKKKWKKVKKRVKVNGKWKTKKVWKYKTAYKKKKVKVKDYWARDNYVYDIGII